MFDVHGAALGAVTVGKRLLAAARALSCPSCGLQRGPIVSGRKEKRFNCQQEFARFGVVVEVKVGQTYRVDEAAKITLQDAHARRLNDLRRILSMGSFVGV